MALVMNRFVDGPLRGVTLPVDHAAQEYRHTVREAAPRGTRVVVYVYRRTGRTTFALLREEDEGLA
jgi:hypothetical protein